MKRRTVLIPIDGSWFSQQILACVTEMLAPNEHHVILLRVAEEPEVTFHPVPLSMTAAWPHLTYGVAREYERTPFPASIDQLEENMRGAIEDELFQIVQYLRSEGYTVETAVRFGDPAEEIIAFAKSEPVDLIAMATHGRTGILHLVLGSVAERVMRRAEVPVLLLRPSVRGYTSIAESDMLS